MLRDTTRHVDSPGIPELAELVDVVKALIASGKAGKEVA